MYHLSSYNQDRRNDLFDIGFYTYRTSLNRIFDDLIYSTGRHLDLDEDDDKFTLTLALPGYKQEHVDVNLEQEVLTIKAKRDERSYEQSVTLPEGVDSDKVEAKLEDGLLSITLGKLPAIKPRKITIK